MFLVLYATSILPKVKLLIFSFAANEKKILLKYSY